MTAPGHAARAARFAADEPRAHWHDQALWFVRLKRDRMAQAVPEWEALRECAARIKAHARAHLAEYLEQFEREATARGIQVHWARDAAEHNAVVHRILSERGVTRLVKSKSMLTEECHLNPYLEARGIEVVDTDLGERIVQLAHEPPSHIVLPAIHKKKEEIGELFHRTIGTEAGPGNGRAVDGSRAGGPPTTSRYAPLARWSSAPSSPRLDRSLMPAPSMRRRLSVVHSTTPVSESRTIAPPSVSASRTQPTPTPALLCRLLSVPIKLLSLRFTVAKLFPTQ